MKKQFLATISNDSNNLYGVRFLCTFFKNLAESSVTLLHICKQDNISKTIVTMWDNPNEEPQGKVSPGARISIKVAKKLLSEVEVPLSQIVVKAVPEKYGKVRDILKESSKGKYDAIVLGRRVSYALQWIFDRPADETFLAMINEHSCVSPLWICPDFDIHRKDILVCIDSSEGCYRAVDHVGYMLSSESHNIMLYHVEKTVDTKCVEYFKKAEDILLGHGIDPQRIQRKVKWGSSVSGTILKEADLGKYAAIVVGMNAKGQETGINRFAGTTTFKLIKNIEKTSLWCCP